MEAGTKMCAGLRRAKALRRKDLRRRKNKKYQELLTIVKNCGMMRGNAIVASE
jgi:hypothetical protein